MQAATRRLEVSASNVANVRSDGALPDAQGNYAADAPRPYTPLRVDQVDLATGGTRAVVSEVSPSYVATYDPSAPYANQDGLVAAPNVDLTEEAIQQLIASLHLRGQCAGGDVLQSDGEVAVRHRRVSAARRLGSKAKRPPVRAASRIANFARMVDGVTP